LALRRITGNRFMRLGLFLVIAALATMISCSRDPNEIKKKYVQTGNKYFSAGKYRQASILYQSAIRKDAKFGEAYYRWALAEIMLDKLAEAVPPLRRAVELLPPGLESRDAKSRLADIYIYYLEGAAKDKNIYAETLRLADELIKSGSGAYDGHRLKGRLATFDAQDASRRGVPNQVKEHLAASIEQFREADAIRPFQTDILIPMARSFIASNQLPEAEKIYLALLDHDKRFVPVYGELYNLYMRERRAGDAEIILERGFANNPHELLFVVNLATHYHSVHREDQALKMIEQLRVLGKGMPHLHQILGSFYTKLGNPDEAIRQYEAGIQAEPNEKNYYRKRIAETLIAVSRNTNARRMIESVLKDDPKDAEARRLLGSNFLQTGDFNNAATELQEAVKSDLLNPIARYLLASALMEQGQLALAMPELQKAIRLEPKYLEPRLKLAQLQILLEQNEGALKTAQDILEDLDARNVQAKLLCSIALRHLNRPEEARAELQSALKLQPNSPDALLQLGELRLNEKNYPEAEQAFWKSYAQNPLDTRGLLRVAEMYIAKNESGRAMQILRSESNKRPDRLELHRMIADMSAVAHDSTSAIAEYQAILAKIDPKLPLASQIQEALGEVYLDSGKYELALDALQKAREGLPKDPALLSNLAVTLLRLGRSADATNLYETTFRLQAENPIALNNLAYLIAEKNGDLDTALTYAQRARQKWPHAYEISDTVAWIYLKKNLNDNAIEILADLVGKRPNMPTFRYHLGVAWWQKGDRARAKKELETALDNHPTSEEKGKIKEILAKAGA
jgi:tetratricopeptide (TPR) repeat protein